MGALNWNTDITKNNQRLYRQSSQNQSTNVTTRQATPKEKPQFRLISATELTAKPVQINWLVENILEHGSLNLMFGEPSAGKSLFALDWGFCVAAGRDWEGYKTQQTDVVIVAGEGYAGMARRLKALEVKYDIKAPGNLYISERPGQLLDNANAESIADSIKATCPNPGLVIVDTLHRNMDGDENSSQDIGKFINNLDCFFKPLGAAVLVVHHSGHSDNKRSRGSSSIKAAMDAEFSVIKNHNSITFACTKAKDFEALKPLSFSLKIVDLPDWLDGDGEPLNSVYLEFDGDAAPNAKGKKLTARDESILASLGGVITAQGRDPTMEIRAKLGDDVLPQKLVHIDHWRDACYSQLDEISTEAKQKAFSRAIKKLTELGKIQSLDSYYWPIFDS